MVYVVEVVEMYMDVVELEIENVVRWSLVLLACSLRARFRKRNVGKLNRN